MKRMALIALASYLFVVLPVIAQEGQTRQPSKPKLSLSRMYLLGCCVRYTVEYKGPGGDWVFHESILNGEVNTPPSSDGKTRQSSRVAKALAKVEGAERVFLDEFIQVNPGMEYLTKTAAKDTEQTLAELDARVRAVLSTIYDVKLIGKPLIAEMCDESYVSPPNKAKNKKNRPRR